MKLLRVVSLFVCTGTACAAFDADDLFDRLDNALTLSAFQNNLRTRVSGLSPGVYPFRASGSGLNDSSIDNLFNPRLTLFLDAQIGRRFYFFGQSADRRGFDPSDHGAQVRLDEYALRFTPWEDGRFNGANRQVRHCRRQLGSATSFLGESIYQCTAGL